MPKRVLDFDAIWASDKLAACAEWAQAEYAWLYGLADASGSFELTNLRVIWGRVAAIRRNLTLDRLEQVFAEFIARGLLFTWEENGKRYGHWTGSDVPGRLPPPSWRARLERLAPPVPRDALTVYAARFGGRYAANRLSANRHPANLDAANGDVNRGAPAANAASPMDVASASPQLNLNLGLEPPQAQDLDLGLEREKKVEVEPSAVLTSATECLGHDESPVTEASGAEREEPIGEPARAIAEAMRQIYEAERGSLPSAGPLTDEHCHRCALRFAEGVSLEDFRAAVRRAAATPFLSGAGERRWQATFDWLVANETNVRKVLDGRYGGPSAESGGVAPAENGRSGLRYSHPRDGRARDDRAARVAVELYAGAGPSAAAFGAHLSAAALARLRARLPVAPAASPPPGHRAEPVVQNRAKGSGLMSQSSVHRHNQNRSVARKLAARSRRSPVAWPSPQAGPARVSKHREQASPVDSPAKGTRCSFGATHVGALLGRVRLHLDTERFLAARRQDAMWAAGCHGAARALERLASRLSGAALAARFSCDPSTTSAIRTRSERASRKRAAR